MKNFVHYIIILLSLNNFAGDTGGGGGTGPRLNLELQSINELKELVMSSDELLKEIALNQIDNLTLEESNEIKYISTSEEALEYLMAPGLESVQLQSGQLITR